MHSLTPLQQEVVSALAAGAPVTATAKAAGLHRSTIYIWQKTNPVFAAALHHIQQSRLARLRGLARCGTFDTFDTPPAPPRAEPTPPRNAPCPCGSRQKYKRCCGRNAPPTLSNAPDSVTPA